MQTRFITTDEEIIILKEDWDRLTASRPETDMPFYSWDWFYRSWIHFGKPEGQELFVVAVYEENQLVGILPLVRGSRKSSGMTYRTLRFCAVGLMPRNTFYTDARQDQEPIFRAAWDHLFENRSVWDMLELANVPDTNPFHRFVLDGKHDTKYALIQKQGFIAPFIELTSTLEDYMDTLSRGTRKDNRRRINRFNEAGYSRLVRFFDKPEEVKEGLKYLETVHNNSWKGAYTNQHYPQFYQEITPVLVERGEAKIAILFLDDESICGGYMLCKNATWYGIITDYDQKYQEYSPGIVLLNYQLEHLLKEGGKIFRSNGSQNVFPE